MKYELVSFKLCPFVQRSVITLLHKDVPHNIIYIDLADPPSWFRELSPLGKVPLLKVDDEAVIFESAVINEFIDETTDSPMHPRDPLKRAVNRAWIEFGSNLLGDNYRLCMAATEADYDKARESLMANLKTLEKQLGDGPYFNGTKMSLVDTAYAPLFMRQAFLNRRHVVVEQGRFPRIDAWSAQLLSLPAVRNSVVPDFDELYTRFIARPGGYAASLFAV